MSHGIGNIFAVFGLAILVVFVLPRVITIPTEGTINHRTLLFSTNFESVTGSSTQSGIDGWMGNTLTGLGSSNRGLPMETGWSWSAYPASYWIEGLNQNNGVPTHSGSRSLGQSMTDGYRNQMYIMEWDWNYSNTYKVSFWRYYPLDFDISHNGGWFQLIQFDDGYHTSTPFVSASLSKTGTAESIHISWDNGGGSPSHGGGVSLDIPWTFIRGEWFKVEFYIDRGTTGNYDASAKLSINNVLMAHTSGFYMRDSANAGDHFAIGLASQYAGDNAGYFYTSARQWTDDVEIYAS